MNTSISYVRYSPSGENRALSESLITCYQEVFAAQPWGEWRKCACCGQSWGQEEASRLAATDNLCCGQKVQDFWPRETVLTDLQNEIGPNTSCWLALANDRVVGFCWGYPLTLAELEEKTKIKIALPTGTRAEGRLAYQDEIGVNAAYRGQKIAKNLYLKYVSDVQEMNVVALTARTKATPEPSIVYSWYTQKQNYQTAAAYPARDGRVILARPALHA